MAFDTQIAAITIYCEASNGTQAEREAIAHVILNRIKAGRWGKTAAAVCLKRYQFSEWNGDQLDNANLMRAAEAADDDATLRACAAAFVWAKNIDDPTNGATHYHDKSIAPPAWTVGATMTLETAKFKFYAGVK